MFDTINEKPLHLPSPIDPECLVWCPVVDLIALVPKGDRSVWVYRLNGQRVWMHALKGEARSLKWRYDGKVLSVVMQDGSWCSLSSANGKVLDEDETADSSCRSWTVKAQVEESKLTLNLDVCKYMPRLSPLPSNYNAFATVSMDEDPGAIELLTSGTTQGGLDMGIYGVFQIGKVAEGQFGSVSQVEANKDLSEHVALVTHQNKSKLKLWNVDFLRKYGYTYLPQVSITPARIMALINYIHDAMATVDSERKGLLNETAKAMDGISDDPSASQCDLFDTLITGVIKESVSYWLKEHLTERGLKKWFKTCLTGYEHSIKILYENCIPALERLMVLLSKLGGLAKWEERGRALGLDPEQIASVSTHTQALMKQFLQLTHQVQKELLLFKGFAQWLELTFEELPDSNFVAGGNGSVITGVGEVKTTDVGKFITQFLTKSTLKDFDASMELILKVKKEANVAFNSIRQAMRDQVKVRQHVELGAGVSVSMRFSPAQDYFYVMVHSQSNLLTIIRFQPGPLAMVEAVKINTEDNISQAEFIDDEQILLLLNCQGDDKRQRLVSSYYTSLLFQLVNVNEIESCGITESSLVVEGARELSTRIKRFAINGQRKVGALINEDCLRYEFISLDEEDDDEDEIME